MPEAISNTVKMIFAARMYFKKIPPKSAIIISAADVPNPKAAIDNPPISGPVLIAAVISAATINPHGKKPKNTPVKYGDLVAIALPGSLRLGSLKCIIPELDSANKINIMPAAIVNDF